MHPLDFEEFFMAMSDDFTYKILKEHFQKRNPFGTIHKKIMYSFREYMLVGGMPQAVLSYLKTKDFGEVDFVKQNILNLYEADMSVQKEENPVYVKKYFGISHPNYLNMINAINYHELIQMREYENIKIR